MIVEVETGNSATDIVFFALALAFAGGFFWLIRRNVLLGLGCAVAGAGCLAAPMISSLLMPPGHRPFAIVIVNHQVSETGFLTQDVFRGGYYNSPSGREVLLAREKDWPASATLIVNDSDRLVIVQRFYFSANSGFATDAPLVKVVFPGEQGVIRGFLHALADEGTPPPNSIP